MPDRARRRSGPDADLRSGPAAGAVRYRPGEAPRTRSGGYTACWRRQVVDADRELLRARRIASRAAQRWAYARAHQGVAGAVVEEDAAHAARTGRERKGRGRRKSSDLAAVEQHLHAAVHPSRKALGYARRFGAEIVNYADDFCVLGKAPAAEMLAVVNRLMARLKLPVKRCLRCPEDLSSSLGRIAAQRTGAGSRASAQDQPYVGRRGGRRTPQPMSCKLLHRAGQPGLQPCTRPAADVRVCTR